MRHDCYMSEPPQKHPGRKLRASLRFDFVDRRKLRRDPSLPMNFVNRRKLSKESGSGAICHILSGATHLGIQAIEKQEFHQRLFSRAFGLAVSTSIAVCQIGALE